MLTRWRADATNKYSDYFSMREREAATEAMAGDLAERAFRRALAPLTSARMSSGVRPT